MSALRNVLFALLATFLAGGLAGCSDDSAIPGNNNVNNNVNNNNNLNNNVNNTGPPFTFTWPATPSVDLDILFLVDDSQSMLNEQANLQAQFVTLANALENMAGGLPNVHIGVITTDLGTANYSTIRFCEEVGGDAGILGKVKGVNLGETCIGPAQRYIVDVEPVSCLINKDQAGVCSSHQCSQQHCDAAALANEVLTLTIDANGCPRCRNYSGTLADTFSCLAGVGPNGCGFEQHLEAMHKALDQASTPENNGFLRDDAYLAFITISDEDDCSASRPDVIFNPDPAENRIDSTLGYLHSFRCFEFGITCDVNGRDLGPRNNCVPRDDQQALLHPISRYTAFLEAMKDPGMVIVAAMAGPFDGGVVVQMDSQNRPELMSTCTDSTGQGATPGIRLKAFVSYFNSAAAMDQWAFTRVCANDFSPALAGMGDHMVAAMSGTGQCLLAPLWGCSLGTGGTLCAVCLPACTIIDVENWGEQDQKRLTVPWCGELCTGGPCTAAEVQPCNYDAEGRCTCGASLYPTRVAGQEGCAPLHYANGAPGTDRDPQLATLLPRVEPTCTGTQCADGTEGLASACWYLGPNTSCAGETELRVVRAADPPERTFLDGECAAAFEQEETCDDGVDNDEDCLTDAFDPDCQ